MRRTPDHFYPSVPPDVIDDSQKLAGILDRLSDVEKIDVIMKHYFMNHWSEFVAFFRDDRIDWLSFACYPPYALYFVQYVFTRYPEVRERVMADLNRALEKRVEKMQ